MALALSENLQGGGVGGGVSSSSTTPRNPFDELVDDLEKMLGPSSGIDSADVDKDELQKRMERYVSDEKEWEKYAFSDYSRPYTRNLVHEGNGKSNLLILVWTPGKESYIHDHANAHCLMRILKGKLKETRYNMPNEDAPPAPPQIRGVKEYPAGKVAYMSDDLGVHKISNPDAENVAVSLHLYTPPNAAKYGCNIFIERAGEKFHVEQNNFYSEFGHKVERGNL